MAGGLAALPFGFGKAGPPVRGAAVARRGCPHNVEDYLAAEGQMMTVPEIPAEAQQQAEASVAGPAAEVLERLAEKLGSKASVSAVFGEPVARAGITWQGTQAGRGRAGRRRGRRRLGRSDRLHRDQRRERRVQAHPRSAGGCRCPAGYACRGPPAPRMVRRLLRPR